ncbi:MAG: hypothetical protein KDD32_03310 [Bacteroidetes bacterium]|nr:hypothetical protein [Bacteroidota bacterium]
MSHFTSRRKGKLMIYIVAIICSIFLILISTKNVSQRIIKLNGIENVAYVTNSEFISFIENDMSGRRISFYRINMKYEHNDVEYNKIFEFSKLDFDKIFGKELVEGDEISIRHLKRYPRRVILD